MQIKIDSTTSTPLLLCDDIHSQDTLLGTPGLYWVGSFLPSEWLNSRNRIHRLHRFIKLLETFLRDLGPFDIRVSHSCCRFIGGSSTLHFSLWQISTWLTWYLRCFAFTDLNTGDKGKTKMSLLCVPLVTSSQSLDPIFFHTVFLFLFFCWWWYEALLTDFKLGWHLVKGKSGALSAVKKCLIVH